MNKPPLNTLFSIIQNLQALPQLQSKTPVAATLAEDSIVVVCQQQARLIIQSFSIETYEHISIKTLQRNQNTDSKFFKVKVINGSYFFIYTKPLALEMCFREANKLVPIELNNAEFPFEDFSCQIEFPSIFIFGGKFKEKQLPLKKLIEIDMYTFQSTKIDLQYGPEARFNHMCHLSEGRIYVFGGMVKENVQVKDGLIWTYDLDKKCWFGIQLIGPEQHFNYTQFRIIKLKPGKIIILSLLNAKMYCLSLSQSSYSLEKSREQSLDNVLTIEAFIKKQNMYKCPLINSSPKKLLVFQKYESMMEYQIGNKMMC